MSERLQDRFGSMQEDMARGYRRAEGMLARNPSQSVLIGFGLGFGLGLIVTTILSRPEESWSDWSERRARESMGHARHTLHHAKQSAMQMPDAFHHLAESIRSLPEAIARHLPSSMGGR